MSEQPTQDAVPRPDPTILTTEQLVRAVAAERDYVNGQLEVLRERLRGIDTATKLLNETVNRVPTDVQKEVAHLRELTDERFTSVSLQFRERDTRSERESRDNKVAVDAAFAAQKEAASEQNKSNTLAITKSEVATTETINKLSELFKTTTDALGDKIDDVKGSVSKLETRLSGIEANKQGHVDQRTTSQSTLNMVVGFAGLIVSLLVIAGILASTGAFK